MPLTASLRLAPPQGAKLLQINPKETHNIFGILPDGSDDEEEAGEGPSDEFSIGPKLTEDIVLQLLNIKSGGPSPTKCVVKHLGGNCSIFDSIDYDLRHWDDNTVSQKMISDAWGQGVKGVLVNWNGKNSVRMVYEHMPSKPQNFQYVKRVHELIVDLVQKVQLPAMEFMLSFRDNPIVNLPSQKGSVPPLFSLSKSAAHADILFPNIVRPQDYKNMKPIRTLRYTFPEMSQKTPWEAKTGKLFWRGGLRGRCIDKNCTTNPRKLLSCMDRNNGRQDSTLVDAGFVEDSDRTSKCQAKRTQYSDAEKYKYLAILQGTGYTGRFKDFMTFGSAIVRWYGGHFDVYEHFEAGLQDRVHLLDLPNSAKIEDLTQLIKWAQANDEAVKEIASRGSDFVRWAFSDRTIDCYLWKALSGYALKLKYDAGGPSSVMDKFFKKEKHKVSKSSQNQFEQKVQALPDQAKHDAFIKACLAIH